jgi:hypothetical protein
MPLAAQEHGSVYQSSMAEVVFVTGSISHHLQSSDPLVSMELNGPVFNDVGKYAPDATSAVLLFDEYATGTDLTASSVYMSRDIDNDVGWESLASDGYYTGASGKCAGLIGWGEYTFTVEIDNSSKSFRLSTLDGNWLDPGLGDDNKIIFYVDFIQDDPQDPIDIVIQVWDYDADDWRSVSADDRITFWELHDAVRERTVITALSDEPFTIQSSSSPYSIPFYNNRHDFDINVEVLSDISIPSGKTIAITDYEYSDGATTAYESTEWKFGTDRSLLCEGGELLVYSQDPIINDQVLPRRAVSLIPNQVKANDARNSWRGMTFRNQATAHIEHALIRLAKMSVKVADADVTLYRSLIDSCHRGVLVEPSEGHGGQTMIIRDTITNCWTGVQYAPTPNHQGEFQWGSFVLIDSSSITRSSTNGIHIGFSQAKNSGASLNSAILPEDNCLIMRSEIKHNNGHGIYANYGLAAVRDCNISRNGWLWGTPFDQIDMRKPKPGGIYLDNTPGINIHSCDFQSNVGPGVSVNNRSTATAVANTTSYSTGEAGGWNCFEGNWVNLEVTSMSTLRFGKYSEPPLPSHNDFNSVRMPRWIHETEQKYVNVYTEEALRAEVEHNFWLPDTDSWVVLRTIYFSGAHPILDADSVRCGENMGFGGPWVSPPYNEDISTLVRRISRDSLQAAWEQCRSSLSDAMDNEIAGIYTWALAALRIFGGLDSARILLENEAFDVGNPDQVSLLDEHALLRLQQVYMMTGDSANSWKTYDTLSARLPMEILDDDSLYAALYEVDLRWYIDADSTQADSLITFLYNDYPHDIRVRNRYIDITGDTSAYWNGALLDKRTEPGRMTPALPSESIAFLGAYPNPFNPTTTIEYTLRSDANVLFRVYGIDGKLIDDIDLGKQSGGVHHYQYDADALPSGMYIGVLDTGHDRVSFKLILNK